MDYKERTTKVNWDGQSVLTGQESGFWFVCHQGQVWLPEGNVPKGTASEFKLTGLQAQIIGEWDTCPCWLVRHPKKRKAFSVRQLLNEEHGLFQMAGRAVQLDEFYRSHQFCGYCATPMHLSNTEWCCLCPHCHHRYYPQICPSMIVAIRHKNRVLLANHTRHRSDKLFTVLAGFVEIGESVEQAIAREVQEEAGICIRNARYVGSQPWPFPNSLMLAYMAEYQSGTLTVDQRELAAAAWFHYTDLPHLPPYGTIARRLIEETILLCRHYDERQGT